MMILMNFKISSKQKVIEFLKIHNSVMKKIALTNSCSKFKNLICQLLAHMTSPADENQLIDNSHYLAKGRNKSMIILTIPLVKL